MTTGLLAAAATLLATAQPAAVDRLDAALRASDSATAVLQAVCDGRGGGLRIEAHAQANRPDPAPPAWVRDALRPAGREPVQYRRVELACGEAVLSRADNWYLPQRLTPEMNRALATTPAPFGRAVAAMGFHRRTLAVARRTPGGVLRHRAVLVDQVGHPFSVVQETYSAAALAP